MKILAFDTSTDVLSIALTDGAQVWRHEGAGGAQASAALIPAIEELMRDAGLHYAELTAIAFGAGPGSFTGLRTACSVAQGLGFGACVPLLAVDSLLAVAEDARARHGDGVASSAGEMRFLAALDARMNQVYAARYRFAGKCFSRAGDFELLAPELLQVEPGEILAGNAAAAYLDRLPAATAASAVQALPTADAMLRLAPTLIEAGALIAPENALPRYIRDKVAQTTLERAAVTASGSAKTMQ